jgi:hypothetical protein
MITQISVKTQNLFNEINDKENNQNMINEHKQFVNQVVKRLKKSIKKNEFIYEKFDREYMDMIGQNNIELNNQIEATNKMRTLYYSKIIYENNKIIMLQNMLTEFIKNKSI